MGVMSSPIGGPAAGVFDVDALLCPHCGSTMRLVAAIDAPSIARKILEFMDLAARAPPLGPARVETLDSERSDDAWLFDQSPVDDEP